LAIRQGADLIGAQERLAHHQGALADPGIVGVVDGVLAERALQVLAGLLVEPGEEQFVAAEPEKIVCASSRP
jgi:hypothetical protein